MINNKKILVVITARANSQGVKNKNFKLINKIPLINYSVKSAQESKCVDVIVISSNCQHVKKAVEPLITGTTAIFIDRPDELATPFSKNESALTHAYYHVKHIFGVDADIIVNLQPTSPVRRKGLIDQCLRQMEDEQSDSLLTVTKSTPFFWRHRGNKIEALYNYKNRPMREEVEMSNTNFYFDNGNVYISRRHVLLDGPSGIGDGACRLGNSPSLFEISKFESYQIDDEEDFDIVETILEKVSTSS